MKHLLFSRHLFEENEAEKGDYSMNLQQGIHRMKRGRIGLALGGGGALGLAHVGVLKALEEFGIHPAVISGNSAGALVGGLYASGMSVETIIELSQELGDNMFDHFKMSLRSGLVSAKHIHHLLLEILGDKRIEDCEIPFYAAAVDLNSGRNYYIYRGRIADAIRASVSVPGIFRPFAANGLLLVDGGTRDSVPLRALEMHRLSLRIAVGLLKTSLNKDFPERLDILPDTEKEEGEKNATPGLTRILSRAMAISSTESTFKSIKLNPPDLALYIDIADKMKIWDFKRHEMAIEEGYRQACEQLKKYFG
ncbi:MAG: patatin-like phospholipase family protein [Candidatus Neomarinimicrobiota bacterium]|jgi:NTE family protein